TYKAPKIFGDKKTCYECLIRVKESKKRKFKESYTTSPNSKETIIDVDNIINIVYEALTNVEDINENLESNYKFYFEQAVSLDILISEIPLDVEKDKYEHYIANKIANYVEQRDGYDYVYHTKTSSQ
ncbi:554_t:CDS:1, partial [Gigaspora rosea]